MGNWWQTMLNKVRQPRTAHKRGAEEVEADLQQAREEHNDAIRSKDNVLREFKRFESRVAAQRR